jgi:cytochrome c-type biogenesis protein CcmH/NrfG
MSEPIRCPDCGHVNPPESISCESCNFPLRAEPSGHEPPPPVAAKSDPIVVPRRRPRRRVRPASNQSLSLWLMFAFVAAAIVVYIGVKANFERESQPVEGSSASQQANADQFEKQLAADSSDVDAHIGLANVLYDTGNWSEAIIHYRAAIRRDSSRVHALVDLGVCYYNLGDPDHAAHLFDLALVRDPHQPVALFNLGIVNERASNYPQALHFFHRALESGPPEDMKQTLVEAIERTQKEAGKTPGPLPDAR